MLRHRVLQCRSISALDLIRVKVQTLPDRTVALAIDDRIPGLGVRSSKTAKREFHAPALRDIGLETRHAKVNAAQHARRLEHPARIAMHEHGIILVLSDRHARSDHPLWGEPVLRLMRLRSSWSMPPASRSSLTC